MYDPMFNYLPYAVAVWAVVLLLSAFAIGLGVWALLVKRGRGGA